MNSTTLLLYLTTWTLVAITPGPAVLYVMSQATHGGVRGSLAGIAGLQLGSLLFFVAVGTGLAALLTAMTTAFTVLQLAGALYLGWIGVNLILGSFRKKSDRTANAAPVAGTPGGSFLKGFLIQLTNPKALLFCSALLPQFLDPQRPVAGQLTLLFAITFAVDVASMLIYAALAARSAQTFRSSAAAVWLERVFGVALIAFGVRLALGRKFTS